MKFDRHSLIKIYAKVLHENISMILFNIEKCNLTFCKSFLFELCLYLWWILKRIRNDMGLKDKEES